MRYIITIFFYCLVVNVCGQGPAIKLPTVIPPSPEVAQLNKVGAMSAGLHTGSANVSIPLYSFSVNSASVNVALSYGSNGIKVDDISSRVGLGWNLVAGGVVSRVIRDEPDGDYPYYPPPSNIYEKDQALLDYLNAAVLDTYDTEWDEYSYSFNGMSGKFFIDANGNGYAIPHNNLKIKVYYHNTASKYIYITTPEGIRYEFGLTVKEKTRNINIGGGNGSVTKTAYYETAWFLEKIVTPEGGTIFFNYSAVFIKTIQGPYQTMIKPIISDYSCNSEPCSYSEQSGLNGLEYDSYYLININTDGIDIDFEYESRPDNSGDKRLSYLAVTPTGHLTANKWFKFSYTDPTYNNSSLNKRYFLSKVSELEIGTGDGLSLTSGNWLTHDLEYIDINSMPARLSYSQDWFGYYNGVNNAYFAPYIPGIESGLLNGSMGANRNPGSLTFMQKGLLNKVIYPTGGDQQFTYEPHTLLKYNSTPTYSNASVNGSGTGTMSPWVHTSPNFTANSDQDISISLSCYKSPAFPDAPSGEGDKIYEIKLKKYSTGEVVFYRKYYYYTTEESFNISLVNNTTYYLELTILGEVNAGSANLNYNPSTVTNYENVIAGGVRVKEISSFDPQVNKIYKKYYTYAALSDLTKSSAVGVFPLMYSNYETAILCNPGMISASMGICNNYMVSSNSLIPYHTFGGSPFAYQNVIESDDPQFKNGFTEHFFTTYTSATVGTNVLGNSMLGTPANITTDLNGLEYKTRVYKKNGNTNILVKEVSNNYDYGNIDNTKTSYMVRQRWKNNIQFSPPIEIEFQGSDLMQYNYVSSWFNLKSSVTTDFDQDGLNPLVTTVNYIYANTSHLQPTEIQSSTSVSAKPKKIQSKYPIDFISTVPGVPNVYDAMVEKHIITPVIEQKVFSASNLLSETKNNYNFWLTNNSLIAPLSMDVGLNGNTVQTRINYNSYSAKGNLLEMQKTGDVKHAYIWGYTPERPTAEVINAGNGDIAYTSFETLQGNGNWVIGSTLFDGTDYITGKASYNLSNGSITKTVNASSSYILSYWTKNVSSFTISGTINVSSIPSAINGWKYFEHTITGVSQVSISGTGFIDELRLYPLGARMFTYTYESLTGISSQSDANSLITNYEYDGLNRLLHIRDRSRNILKKFQYKYGEVVPCTNTTANWQITGELRCIKNSNNNNTGEQQREEKDINNCSPTYSNTRWVSLGTNYTSCPVVANCTAENKRVIGSVCEDGIKIITSSTIINGITYCTYHYEWSDGYWSPNYQSSGSDCLTIE